MTSLHPALGEIACIALEGIDARRFAQAQFSGDVEVLAPGQWQWNAWLTAQGRVRALMHLAAIGDDRLLLVLRGGDAMAIHANLSRYVLRMDARLTLRHHPAFAGDTAAAGAAWIETDGAVVLGYGARSLRLSPAAVMPADPTTLHDWALQDIRAGWPTLPTGDSDFLPPALGLEHLGGVAFKKGCYPGQEIAARLHFRGGHKNRLHHLRGAQALPLGQFRDADHGGVSVLATAVVHDASEALVVMPVTQSMNINILGYNYDVVSIFDA